VAINILKAFKIIFAKAFNIKLFLALANIKLAKKAYKALIKINSSL
jgi:hypothetical protein